MRLCLLPIAALLLAIRTLPAQEWPQWRGPMRDGVAAAARLPETWPAKAPEPRWRVRVGEGYSSPVVKDGRLFVMGGEPDGQETCLCFDAVSGKRLWRHAYPAPYKP